LDSPYRTPQTHVGGPRLDAALAASSARTATTKAMGKGSTQVQHLVQTELPKKVLEDWLATWSEFNGIDERLSVRLRPSREGADLLELEVLGDNGDKKANVVFAPIQDRKGQVILSVRDQNTFDTSLRQKRLMTLVHLYLFNRFKANAAHYVAPTEDNSHQCKRMKDWGIYSTVSNEIGQIIVAQVNTDTVATLTATNGDAIGKLIRNEK
jgi:isocitrate lyase